MHSPPPINPSTNRGEPPSLGGEHDGGFRYGTGARKRPPDRRTMAGGAFLLPSAQGCPPTTRTRPFRLIAPFLRLASRTSATSWSLASPWKFSFPLTVSYQAPGTRRMRAGRWMRPQTREQGIFRQRNMKLLPDEIPCSLVRVVAAILAPWHQLRSRPDLLPAAAAVPTCPRVSQRSR